MSDTAQKARMVRLQRLQSMLDQHLAHPPAALDALTTELAIGERHPDLWEQLHAAAARDGKEAELAAAYRKVANARRLSRLEPSAHADVLIHAADFFLGALGDREGADGLLLRALELVPDHLEAFTRLERRFNDAADRLHLAELYATVAANPPKSPDEVARNALNTVVRLPAKTPLPEEACKRLLRLVSASSGLLDALDAHCIKTDRAELACALRAQALEEGLVPASKVSEHRRRLVELYLTQSSTPEAAISHVEELLQQHPNDTQARAAADQLLSNRQVASRAAAALQEARRQGRSAG